jgi:hypothetical protein
MAIRVLRQSVDANAQHDPQAPWLRIGGKYFFHTERPLNESGGSMTPLLRFPVELSLKSCENCASNSDVCAKSDLDGGLPLNVWAVLAVDPQHLFDIFFDILYLFFCCCCCC